MVHATVTGSHQMPTSCSPVENHEGNQREGNNATAGGIAAWSEHPLLSDALLQIIDRSIDPNQYPCLAFVNRWQHQSDMRQYHQSLVDLRQSRFAPTPTVSEPEREAYIAQSLKEQVIGFSRAHRATIISPTQGAAGSAVGQPCTESVRSLQDELWQLLQELVPEDCVDDAFEAGICKQLFARASWVLFLQNVGDDPRYTPHGHEHSRNVANWMKAIVQLQPQDFKTFCQAYALSSKQGTALGRLCGLLHDCGYPYMGVAKPDTRPTKATHAVIGGAMFFKIVQPVLARLLHQAGVRQVSELCRLMARAIHLHSSDQANSETKNCVQLSTKSGALFQLPSIQELPKLRPLLSRFGDDLHRIKTTADTRDCELALRGLHGQTSIVIDQVKSLPPSRLLDAHWMGDASLSTPCVKVKQTNMPLAYWLMLADNLEITHERLGQLQGSAAYGSLMAQVHGFVGTGDSELRAQDHSRAMRQFAETLNQRMPFSPSPIALLLHVSVTQPKDFLYLIGTWVMKKIELKKSRANRLKIVAHLGALPDWLMSSKNSQLDSNTLPSVFDCRYHGVKRLWEAINNLVPMPELQVWDENVCYNINGPDALSALVSSSVAPGCDSQEPKVKAERVCA